jgi:hypothetical protein
MCRTAWDVVSAHETKDGTGITNTAQLGQKTGEVRGRAHGSGGSKPAQFRDSTFTCRISLCPDYEDSQSDAATLVFCQSTQCQPKHVTERLESPTPHREIFLPCGTPRPQPAVFSHLKYRT